MKIRILVTQWSNQLNKYLDGESQLEKDQQ